MVQAAGPIMVAVIAHGLYPEERLDARRVAGVLVGFVGMGLLIGPAALPGLEGMSLPHALAMVATAALYSVGALYVRAIPKAEPIRLAFGQQLFGTIPGRHAGAPLPRPGELRARGAERPAAARTGRARDGGADLPVHCVCCAPPGRPAPRWWDTCSQSLRRPSAGSS